LRIGIFITIIIILLLFPAAVFAVDVEGIQFSFGNAIILNAEPVEVSPAPTVVAPMLGVAVPMTFTDILYFEPGLRFYTTIVTLTDDNKAVPAADETAGSVSVLNCELRPEIGAIFDIGETIAIGVTGAPVLTFRIPVNAEDEENGESHKTAVSEYYYGSARFLGFYAGGFFSWAFGGHSVLRLKAGTNLPVYHLWDGDDAGFYDQLVIEPEIGMVFRF